MKKKIFDSYAEAVAKHFSLSLHELFRKTKKRDIVDARQMLYFLCLERPMRISSIVRFLNEYGYDVGYSTIYNGYNRAIKNLEDEDYSSIVNQVKQSNV